MGWQEDLVRLYGLHEREAGMPANDGSAMLLPVYHQEKRAHLTVRIDSRGNFLSASKPGEGESWLTVIPVTEESAARTSGKPKPVHPLCEQLQYVSGKFPGREKEHASYVEHLERWASSGHSHGKVRAVLEYIRKDTIRSDIRSAGCIVEQAKAGTVKKINGVAMEKWMVRFAIAGEGGTEECWLDPSLFASWAGFYNEELSGRERSACCITGESTYITYSHPADIRYTGDKAKLFSSNRDQDFTFKGRVGTKEEAYGIGYGASQKMHQALRWVIKKCGVRVGCLCIMVWEDAMGSLPAWHEASWDAGEIKEEGGDADIHILALNSASTEGKGRLSVVETQTMKKKEYLENISQWHKTHASLQYYWEGDGLAPCRGVPGVKAILSLAYGTEKGGKLALEAGRQEEKAALALFRSIVYGDPVPKNLTDTLIRRISREPSGRMNQMRRVHTTRGLLSTGNGKEKEMECSKYKVDPENRSRDYLYGRLLAVADYLEFQTYTKEERNGRETNARRYWPAFEVDPQRTWPLIYSQLNPYLGRAETGLRLKCAHLITEIASMMGREDRESRAKLGPMYLFGYSDQAEDLRTIRGGTQQEQEMEQAVLHAQGAA